MSREHGWAVSICAVLGVIATVAAVAFAPAAPGIALAGTAGAVGLLCWVATRDAGSNGTLPPTPSRWLISVIVLFAVLAAKDLLPVPLPSGSEERKAALAVSQLEWPANSRNPALGAAATQGAAVLLGGSVALALAAVTAGSTARGVFVLQGMAWLIAVFGAAVFRNGIGGAAYGDKQVWIAGSKNGAAALISLGWVLHAGLAWFAARKSRIPWAAVHAVTAGALTWPLVLLSSWTGLLALAAGVAALPLLAYRGERTWRPWVVAAAAGIGLAISAAAYQAALVRRVAEMQTDFRLQIWRDCISLFSEQPLLGVGAGAFQYVYPLTGKLHLAINVKLTHPDSSWVLLLVEWGLVPAAFAAFLLWKILGNNPSRGEGVGPVAIARAGITSWAAAGLTDIAWHRPENFAAGVALLGIAAGTRARDAGFSRTRFAGAAALAAGLTLMIWSAGPGARDLRWGLLDPARLWDVANAGGPDRARTAQNLARLDAAVKLRHRSVSYPIAVARLLHPVSPELAFGYWRTAVERAGGRGFDFLAQAAAEFPATSAGYWLALARATGRDNFLFVPGLDGAEAMKDLEAWVAAPGDGPVVPAVAGQFLRVARRLERADLVEKAWPRLQTAATGLNAEAARLLLDHNRPAAAWRALAASLPPADPGTTEARRPGGSLEMMIAAQRFAELRLWVLAAKPGEEAAALGKICAHPKSPAWFHFAHARALAAGGDERGAATAALRGLATQAAAR
jgi:O-antigen ligase